MTREPKKTETLELRVSSETKSALQAKAKADGRTVSEALRQLIALYLGHRIPVIQRRRAIMRLSSFVAGAAALVICVFALAPAANAGGVVLGVSALIDRPATPNGTRTVAASIELNFGETILLCVPARASESGAGLQTAEAITDCAFDGEPGYAILLSANSAPDDEVLIRAHVLNAGETAMPDTASAFLVKFDSWAAMQTSQEQGAQSMRLTFFPRRL